MENFAYPLAIAAISALGIIAYRHPRPFRKIYWVLAAVSTLIYFAILIWGIAFKTALDSVGATIKTEKPLPLQQIYDQHNFSGDVATGIYFSFTAYLILLVFLPEILGIDDKAP